VRSQISDPVVEQYKRWGVTPVRFGSLASLKLLRRARLVVGGGQLLDDTLSAWPVGWTSLVLVANAVSGRRPLILCIGAEPINRKVTALVARLCYSLSEVCSCRDPESLEIAKSLGLKRVVATRDVVFSLDRTLLPERKTKANGVPRIALALAHDPQRTPGKANYFSELAKEIVNAGCEVCFVAHDLRLEYDYGLLLDLEREFENDPRVTISKPRSVEEVLQVYADSDAVVSGRMHPLILASLVRSLPIAISGTAKVKSLIKALGLPAIDRSERQGAKVDNILSFLSRKESYMRAIDDRIAEFAPVVEATTAQALIG
jgi:polysaccharide pyruvyl transferase WcaK-like protein